MKRIRPETLLALAAFVVLALVLTRPLAGHLRDEIPFSPPALDPVALLYAVTWGARALLGDPLHYFQAALFHPYSSSLAFFDLMAGISALAAPVHRITGNLCLGFNVAWLLTFVLSGFGAFLLARTLTGRPAAGLLAGVLFAFHPFRYHNAGQINVLAVMWIPFALLNLHLWIRRGGRVHLVLAAAFALLQFLSSAYTGVFLLLAALLYLGLLLGLEQRPTLERLRRDRRWILVLAGACLLAALPFVMPYLAVARELGAFRRFPGESALYSAAPIDFLTPAPGSLLRPLAPWAGHARHALFPGALAAALGLVWLVRRGWRGHPWRTELIFYALLVPAALLLAMGPFIGPPGSRVPLPFGLLWFILPGGSYIRAPVRFVTLMSLGMAVLAAAGLAGAHRAHPGADGDGRSPARRRSWLPRPAWLAPALAAIELSAAPVQLIRPLPRETPAAYAWLASLPDPVVIAELPMQPDEVGENDVYARYQLYSLRHGKRLVNGVAAYLPPITRELCRVMPCFPDDESLARLRELGVDYVLIHADLYPPDAPARLRASLQARADLEIVSMDGPVWVVRIAKSGADGRPGAGSR